MTTKLLSFDVFGTLVDVRAGSHEAFRSILRESNAAGIAVEHFWEYWEERNIAHYREPYRRYREICELSLAEAFDHFGIHGRTALIERYFDAFCNFRFYADVRPSLDALGRRYRLAIVSNIDDDLLDATPLGLEFDPICTAERARGYKPDGTLFRYLIEHAGAATEEILHTDLPEITTCRNAALNVPLVFEPGERWEYGISIDWVGKIIEAVSEQKLGAYLRDHVLAPLDMHDTAFRISPAMRVRLAKVHQRGEDDRLAAIEFEIPQEPEFEMGGGGLYSTAPDYLKFIRMILNAGNGASGRVLKPETVEMMSRNQMGDLSVRLLKTAVPAVTNDAEFFPGMRKTWGLSFMINTEKAPTGRSPGSLAWAGLANTYFWIDPTKGIGGVYLTQLFPFADRKSVPLFFAFEKAVYQSLG